MRLLLNLVLTSPLYTSAFTFVKSNNFQWKSSIFMSDDQPSDSSSEFTVDVESDEYTPTETETLALNLMDDLPSTLGDVDSDIRTSINEKLIKLEMLNPTENPAMSSVLNGVWTLKYSGGYTSEGALSSPTRQLALFLYSGGYSPGIFALTLAKQLPAVLVEVGDLLISLSRDNPRIQAKVDVKFLGGSSSEIVLDAQMDVLSDVRMRETYLTFAKLLGREVAIPDALQYSRDLYITYLDADLLVIRDASGVPEVLVRNK